MFSKKKIKENMDSEISDIFQLKIVAKNAALGSQGSIVCICVLK